MSRAFHWTLVALAVVALDAAGAGAGTIERTFSTLPTHICLVGAQGGAPDTKAGQFTIVVRDLASNPIANSSVALDFSNCPRVHLCSDQLDANMQTNCAARRVQKWTDAAGEVTFTLIGNGRRDDVGYPGDTAVILGDGIFFGYVTVATFDLDGGGVGASDLSVWLTDFATGLPYQRSDYDGDGQVGAADLAEWLTVFGAGGSAQSCGASCP